MKLINKLSYGDEKLNETNKDQSNESMSVVNKGGNNF